MILHSTPQNKTKMTYDILNKFQFFITFLKCLHTPFEKFAYFNDKF